jgi:phosphatidylglycerophosphate synthase
MVLAAEHALSLGRVGLAALVLSELAGSTTSRWVLAAVGLACGSDFLDGRVARARGSVGTAGRWLDNVCDVAFLAACFWSFARAKTFSDSSAASDGAWPTTYWDYLPLWALGFSFGAYALRVAASAIGRRPIAPSPLGHWAGIANYCLALVGGAAVHPAIEIGPPIVGLAVVGTLAINLAAGLQNLVLLAGAASTSR